MSLDIYLFKINQIPAGQTCCGEPINVIDCVYHSNITRNLSNMADKAGIFDELWQPKKIGKMKAKELIEPFEKALADLKARPEYFKEFNAKNGWGTYDQFISFLEEYLEACKKYPDAGITVS